MSEINAATQEKIANMTGIRKGAILLLSLDEDTAVDVFKHFTPQQIQKISKEMTTLQNVSRDEIKWVLEQFHAEFEEMPPVDEYDGYIRSVLTKALGSERASSLIEDVLDQKAGNYGIDALNLMDSQEVAELIRDEHPQIIATILIHLDRQQASGVLEVFDERLRNDVVLRIATFTGVQPAALQELTEVLGGMLDGQNLKRSKMGGIRTAAEILNLLNGSQEDTALENIRAFNEELASKIVDEMFLFENLIELDDRSVQVLLKQIDTNSLVIALKGSEADLVDKFLRNMSQRAAQLVREEMETRGPVRLSQVETEQKAILAITRRLADSGEIMLSSGDDTYV